MLLQRKGLSALDRHVNVHLPSASNQTQHGTSVSSLNLSIFLLVHSDPEPKKTPVDAFVCLTFVKDGAA